MTFSLKKHMRVKLASTERDTVRILSGMSEDQRRKQDSDARRAIELGAYDWVFSCAIKKLDMLGGAK